MGLFGVIHIFGVKLRRLVLLLTFVSLFGPALLTLLAKAESADVFIEIIGSAYLITLAFAIAASLYQCGVVMRKAGNLSDSPRVADGEVRRLLYLAAALLSVFLGLVLTKAM